MTTVNIPEKLYEKLQIHARAQDMSLEAFLEHYCGDVADNCTNSHTEQHNLYKAMVENSVQGMIVVQGDRVVFANEALATLTGYTVDDFLGLTTDELSSHIIHPNNHDLAKENFRRQLHGEMIDNRQPCQLVHTDGKLSWVDCTAVQIEYLGKSAHHITFVDVTERKRIEQELQDSKFLYRAIVAALPGTGVMLVDRDLRYIIAEGTELKATGYSKEALEGNLMADVLSPAFFTAIEENIRSAFDNKTVQTDLNRGDNSYYQITYIPIKNSENDITHCLIAATNITKLKQAQLHHLELIDQLQLAIDVAGLGMWYLDPHTREYEWNDRLYEIYGLDKNTNLINGDIWRQHIHPDDRIRAENTIYDLIKTGESETIDFRVLRPSGELRYVKSSCTSVYDADGKLSKIVGVHVDITEYEESQQDLLLSKLRYETLFDGVPNAITVFDELGNIVMLNEASRKLFDAQLPDIIGYPLRKYFPEFHAGVVQIIDNILDTLESKYYEQEIELGGETRWLGSVAQPMTTDGIKFDWVQIISHDITEHKLTEQLTREHILLEEQIQRQQDLLEQRNQMLSVLSHELRTPLAVILNATTMLSTYNQHLSDEARAEKVNKIRQQVNVLTMLLDDMSAHAKQTPTFFDYRPSDVNIPHLIDELMEEIVVVSAENHVIDSHIELTEPIAFFDRRLMYHALSNLLTNAVKYSPNGGLIYVTVSANSDEIRFTVIDEGIGIPETDLLTLLKPFHRASNVGAIRGTGMGLSIVSEITDLHGGYVQVDSQLGKGSTFSIIIPIKQEAQPHDAHFSS